ncbi:hypothetical protein BKN14_03380 [Candidatus Gracilibacteria bacterium HOT-871]|nr:hypothetical protein BKN14_03380 [Candidatus Gracilibacteria bacterium HOT-871]MBB1564701.1 hypothetical protein [Candidatus Gracilibacteria bacterium]
MSKKIIFSSALVATSLFLTSCGNAQLGTFQDEMKDEQRSYAKNIDEYISKLEGFTEGKFDSKADINVSAEIPNDFKGQFSVKSNSKSIFENGNLAGQGNIDLGLSFSTAEKPKLTQLEEIAGGNADAKTSIGWGFVDKNLLFSVKDLSLVSKIKDVDLKSQFESVKTKLAGNWISFDFSKNKEFLTFFEEVLKKSSKSTEIVAGYKEFLVTLVSGDIFKDAQKTKYKDGNTEYDAYSFKIDEQKLRNHIKVSASAFLDVVSKIQPDLKEEKASILKDLEEGLVNLKVTQFEGYLYKKGSSTNLVIEKLAFEGMPKDQFITIKILENEIIISNNPALDGKFAFSLKNDSSNLAYNVDIFPTDEKDGKINFSGNLKITRSGNSIDSKFDFKATAIGAKPKEMGIDQAVFAFSVSQNTKKDDSIKITKESIVGNGKILTDEESQKLFQEVFGGIVPIVPAGNLNSVEVEVSSGATTEATINTGTTVEIKTSSGTTNEKKVETKAN